MTDSAVPPEGVTTPPASQRATESDRLRDDIAAVIRDRHDGDFAPILPKLQRLLNESNPPAATDGGDRG